MPAATPLTTAARVKAARRRRSRGLLLVPVEVGYGQALALVRLGLLGNAEHQDGRALGRAVERFLAGVEAVADLGAAIYSGQEDADE